MYLNLKHCCLSQQVSYIYSPQLDPLTCNGPFGIGCPCLRSFEISPQEMSVFTECDGARRLLVLKSVKYILKTLNLNVPTERSHRLDNITAKLR